jgi:hypothetical protein
VRRGVANVAGVFGKEDSQFCPMLQFEANNEVELHIWVGCAAPMGRGSYPDLSPIAGSQEDLAYWDG